MTRMCAALTLMPLAWAIPPTVAPMPTNPGVVVEMEIVEFAPDARKTGRIAVEGQNLHMTLASAAGDPETEMIFRGDRREMIAVDHGRRTYVVLDEATIERLSAQLNDAMSQMEAQLRNLPPEQRAMVEQMMRGRTGRGGAAAAPVAPAEVRATSERADQAGYPARKYEVVRDGRVRRELWVTEWGNVNGAGEFRQVFEAMAAFIETLMQALAQNPMLGGMMPAGNPFDNLAQVNGFPVVTIELDEAGDRVSETRLLSSRTETIAAAEFEPPADYTRQEIGG
jgi:hypothetical protein